MAAPATSSIASNLHSIRARVAAAALRAGRDAASVRLVAVSKTYSRDAIEIALAEGQIEFGENRLQEALAKFPELRAQHPELRLHLIGSLQTNKARQAVREADVIASLGSVRLAEAVASASHAEARLPDLLVQVNVGSEPQKNGVSRPEADAFIAYCQNRFGSKLIGLMCIPPANQDPVPHFSWLSRCAARHGLTEISMGMSDDFEIAILHGSTEIRVGTAIFGNRD